MRPDVVLHVSATLLLLSACSDHGYDTFGGRCTLSPAAPQCNLSAQDRTAALTICGDLTADNTLNVSSSGTTTAALWVRGNARTTSPLTANGNYWSGTNQATNTQSISGTTLASQAVPCVRDALAARDALDAIQLSEPTTVTLGCDYEQTSLDISNTLDVEIEGAVAWVVAGDLHIAAPMHVTLAPGASLTLLACT